MDCCLPQEHLAYSVPEIFLESPSFGKLALKKYKRHYTNDNSFSYSIQEFATVDEPHFVIRDLISDKRGIPVSVKTTFCKSPFYAVITNLDYKSSKSHTVIRVDKNQKEFCFVSAFYSYYPFKFKFNKNRSHLEPMVFTDLQKLIPTFYGWNEVLHAETELSMIEKRLSRFIDLRKFKFDQDYVATELSPVWHPLLQKTIDYSAYINHTDEDVYERFCKYVNVQYRPNGDSFSGRHSYRYHDLHPVECLRMRLGFTGEQFISWESIKGGFSFTCIPRNVRKDGSLRTVFPMSCKLNAFITQTFGDQEPALPKNVKYVDGFFREKLLKNNYDVRKCDELIFPYWCRFVTEKLPQYKDKLLVPCYYNGDAYQLKQFPSGMCCFMKSVIPAFVCALFDLGKDGERVYIQGDGFSIDRVIDSPYLTQYPSGVINGFDYTTGYPRYVNGALKLSTPILLGSARLKGIHLWEFRREVYRRFLFAVNLPPARNTKYERIYRMLSDKELFALIADVDEHILRFETVSQIKELYGENIDSIPTDGIRLV